jgi:hypothetical protein
MLSTGTRVQKTRIEIRGTSVESGRLGKLLIPRVVTGLVDPFRLRPFFMRGAAREGGGNYGGFGCPMTDAALSNISAAINFPSGRMQLPEILAHFRANKLSVGRLTPGNNFLKFIACNWVKLPSQYGWWVDVLPRPMSDFDKV